MRALEEKARRGSRAIRAAADLARTSNWSLASSRVGWQEADESQNGRGPKPKYHVSKEQADHMIQITSAHITYLIKLAGI
jgi:hypothetical protein